MVRYKYYVYDDMPLTDYCRLNKLDYNRVKLGLDKGFNIKDALQYAKEIGDKGNHCLYMYKGESLRKYCIREGLGYATIQKKIISGFTVADAVEWYERNIK